MLTLTEPERINDFVQTMTAFYQESPDHALPMWPLASFETWCMIGYHAVPVIWDAYEKGFRGFDAELAYKAMRETAVASRYHQDDYQKYGYIPQARRTSSVARTLEFAYDDWCIAQMAKALGKTELDAALFTKRSQSYKNVFDPSVGFFRAKTADGQFVGSFDPKNVSYDYYIEADAWHYAYPVMQDVPGMIELYAEARSRSSKSSTNCLRKIPISIRRWRMPPASSASTRTATSRVITSSICMRWPERNTRPRCARTKRWCCITTIPSKAFVAMTIAAKYRLGTSGARWDSIP